MTLAKTVNTANEPLSADVVLILSSRIWQVYLNDQSLHFAEANEQTDRHLLLLLERVP